MRISGPLRRLRWQTKLVTMFALVLGMATVCQFFCVIPYVIYHEVNRAEKIQREELETLARILESRIEQLIAELEEETRALDPLTVARANEKQPAVLPIPVASTQAVILLKSDGTEARILPGQGDLEYQRARQLLPAIREHLTSKLPRFWPLPSDSRTGISPKTCVCTVPWPGNGDPPQAQVILLAKLEPIKNVLRNWPLLPVESAYLVDHQGVVLAHSLLDLPALRTGSLVFKEAGLLQVSGLPQQKQTENVTSSYGEGNLLGGYLSLRKYNLGLALEMPREATARGTAEMFWQLLLVDIGIFLAALAAVLIFMRGISLERSRFEEKLRRSETRYRNVFENIRDLYFQVDAAGNFAEVSPSAEAMTPYTVEELSSMKLQDLCVNPVDGEKLLAVINSEGQLQDAEVLLRNRDGSVRFCSVSASIAKTEGKDGGPYVSGTIRDISVRKQMEEERRRSGETAQALLNASFDMALLIDRDYRIIAVNHAATAALEQPSKKLVGSRMDDFFPPETARGRREVLETVFQKGRPAQLEDSANDRTHSLRAQPVFGPTGHVIGAAFFIRDVTEQRRLEEQMSHAAKMEALGQLAGGIAHDFNNLLTGIVGYADVLARKLDNQPALEHYTERLQNAAQRASDVNRQLLTFARHDQVDTGTVDLHILIEEAISLAGHGAGRGIAVQQRLQANETGVVGDAGELQNALLNVIINAHEAMAERGTLEIRTENVTLGEDDLVPGFSQMKPGQYIRLHIIDDGCGMEPEVLRRMFEPFYTTKTDGGGLGLGLASTYASIHAHGGAISAESSVGKGTAFTVLLPSCADQPQKKGRDPLMPARAGAAKIMVVDDEEIILEMTREILGSLGYSVFTCTSGSEALALYRACWQEVGLVLLDMIMPGLDGTEVLLSFRNINPDLRVIVATGHSDGPEMQAIRDAGAAEIIMKPFTPSTLSRVVAEHIAP